MPEWKKEQGISIVIKCQESITLIAKHVNMFLRHSMRSFTEEERLLALRISLACYRPPNSNFGKASSTARAPYGQHQKSKVYTLTSKAHPEVLESKSPCDCWVSPACWQWPARRPQCNRNPSVQGQAQETNPCFQKTYSKTQNQAIKISLETLRHPISKRPSAAFWSNMLSLDAHALLHRL